MASTTWTGLGAGALAVGLGGALTVIGTGGGSDPLRLVTSDGAFEVGDRAAHGVVEQRRASAHDITVRAADGASALEELCGGRADIALVADALPEAACAHAALEEWPLAHQIAVIAVAVDNTFVDVIDTAALRRVFAEPSNEGLTFADLDPRWPPIAIHAYGLDADADLHRLLARRLDRPRLAGDFAALASSVDVAHAVAGDDDAIGFLGATRPGALAASVRLVPVRAQGGEAVYATRETLERDAYPLAARLRLVVTTGAPRGDEIRWFVDDVRKTFASVSGEADCLAVIGNGEAVAHR